MFDDKFTKLNQIFAELVGLRVFRSWNIFGTRIFYLTACLNNDLAEEYCRITLECSWRIEQNNTILVGSDDYGVRAEGNDDPDWDPRDMQWGHLQDQKLKEIFGEEKDGSLVSSRSDLVVDGFTSDTLGGFQLHLSGGYILSVFPASSVDLEWLLSRQGGWNLALENRVLSESRMPSNSDI